ncbi:MAG: hypothetical protein KDB21_21120 [Acidimicrobiales bacterium]|nr:hypothetical protein [Acidimicrobiales bacterium]
MAAFSLLLIAAGAVLTFAVDVLVDGVDLAAVGVILMIVGGVGLVVSLLRGRSAGFRTERHVSDDGRHVVEETHSVL